VPSLDVVVGVSGGSGARLGKRFVEIALGARNLGRLHLVISEPALMVARTEIDAAIATAKDWAAALETKASLRKGLKIHENADVGASIASGSYPTAGMAVVPCSGGTLGAIANGIARDLLQRAADVCLKERRPLVLALRESPYSLVHIENMRRVTRAGAIVAPPTPAFYVDAPSVDRFLDAWCVRACRMLGLAPRGEEFRWEGAPSPRRRRKK
jgi:4-hydroxy-3-polyprenylbenzoate decarboxylase